MEPVGELNLGHLPDLWRLLDAAEGRVTLLRESPTTNLLTARRMDEAQPAGHRVYVGAYRYLLVGFDNLSALRALLEHHGATPWAPWTLLRAVLEAGFWAAWILDPTDGRERRLRGLRAEVRDWREHGAFVRALGVPDKEQRLAESSTSYRREAEALNEPWHRVVQRITVVDELPRIRVVSDAEGDLGPMMVGAWRALSGLQHGFAYASLLTSDREAVMPMPGGEVLHLSINDDRFQIMGMAAGWILLEAANAFVLRSTRP